MARVKGTHFAVTANLTESGSPVYLTPTNSWSPRLADAWCVESEAEAEARAVSAAEREQRLVADPYAIPVARSGETLDPITAREGIRAFGPSVPLRRPDPTP